MSKAKTPSRPNSKSQPRENSRELLRHIPQVDRALASSEFEPLFDNYSRARVARGLRHVLEEVRHRALAGKLTAEDLGLEVLRGRLEAYLVREARPFYRPVINATGVILHTGLGRAPLAAEAIQAIAESAAGGQRVEISLDSGERGGRDRGCDLLVRRLTGCEAATVVNNNAAATLVILAALARGKGVLLSRGEMVEIGGSYRVPTIMEESGARLVDVGTTNRTHAEDYRRAINEETGMILKVHTSNYRVVGFTKEVDIPTLVEIAREHDLPVVHDMGSGGLIDLAAHGRSGEDWVRDSIAAGADLVCFSGDKLLGGPQAGIIAGRREAVEKCRRHPLFRTIRPGRLVYTALEATLRLYVDGEEEAIRQIPALERLLVDGEKLRPRAEKLADGLQGLKGLRAEAAECFSQAGSGSLPARPISSWGVRLIPTAGGSVVSTTGLAAELRRGDPAILARVQDEAVILDLRTLTEEEALRVQTRIRDLFSEG